VRCYLNLVSQEARSYANRSNAMCCRYGRSDFGSCSSSIFQRHRDHVLCLESNDDGGGDTSSFNVLGLAARAAKERGSITAPR